MTNILMDWINSNRSELEKKGFTVTAFEENEGICTSANIDSDSIIGTISFWKPTKFEFQFNDCNTEKVVCIETVNLKNVGEVTAFFNDLMVQLDKKEIR